MKITCVVATLVTCVANAAVPPPECDVNTKCYFVSLHAAGLADGSWGLPYQTIEAAQEAARLWDRRTRLNNVAIVLRAGRYELDKPLLFNQSDTSPLGRTYLMGEPGERVILTGGREYFSSTDENIISVPINLGVRRIYTPSGVPYKLARWPYDGYGRVRYWGRYSNNDINSTEEPSEIWIDKPDASVQINAGLEIDIQREFGLNIFPVSYVDDSHPEFLRIVFESAEAAAAFRMKFPRKWPGAAFSVTGSAKFLRGPGEWVNDVFSGRTLVWLYSGDRRVIFPHLETLIRVSGEREAKVRGLSIKDITIADTNWNAPFGGVVPIQANIRHWHSVGGEQVIPGAVMIKDATDISFERIEFSRIGANAIVSIGELIDFTLTGSSFSQISGSAVVVGADTPRPESGIMSKNVSIDSNLFSDVGVVYSGAVPVFGGYVSNFSVTCNVINGAPYTGVSIGWGWGKGLSGMSGNMVAGNVINSAVSVLSDGGYIYLIGAQSNSVIFGNVLVWGPTSPWATFKHFAGVYLDNGVSGVSVFDNYIINFPSVDGVYGVYDQKGNRGNTIGGQLQGGYLDKKCMTLPPETVSHGALLETGPAVLNPI